MKTRYRGAMKRARILLLIGCATCADALPVEPTLEATRRSTREATLVVALDAADEQIRVVIAQVQALCDAGGVNRGQCIALSATLGAAQRSARAGNTTAAAQQLGAFIHQVVAFGRADILDPIEVQSLVAEAGKAIAALGG